MTLNIGLIGAGEMGAGLARAFGAAGHAVYACLHGRSEESVTRAREAGLTDLPNLESVVQQADILFSVIPTEHAKPVAETIVHIMRDTACTPVYVEANAIAPALTREIADLFQDSDTVFIDAGLIGPPPGTHARPRLYDCGADLALVERLNGVGFDLVALDGPIGQASAFKMTYAAMTKGTNALLTNVMMAAEAHGILDLFLAEIGKSQGTLADRAQANIPRLPCDAARWQDEMHQIARSFDDAGLPGEFHRGAAQVMEMLAASPFGHETRRTRDKSRDLKATIQGVRGAM